MFFAKKVGSVGFEPTTDFGLRRRNMLEGWTTQSLCLAKDNHLLEGGACLLTLSGIDTWTVSDQDRFP